MQAALRSLRAAPKGASIARSAESRPPDRDQLSLMKTQSECLSPTLPARLTVESGNAFGSLVFHHLKNKVADAPCVAQAVFHLLALATQYGTGDNHASILGSYHQRSRMGNRMS